MADQFETAKDAFNAMLIGRAKKEFVGGANTLSVREGEFGVVVRVRVRVRG